MNFHGELERKTAAVVKLQSCGSRGNDSWYRCIAREASRPICYAKPFTSRYTAPPMSSYSKPSMSFFQIVICEWFNIEVTSLSVMNCNPPRISVTSPKLHAGGSVGELACEACTRVTSSQKQQVHGKQHDLYPPDLVEEVSPRRNAPSVGNGAIKRVNRAIGVLQQGRYSSALCQLDTIMHHSLW